MSFYELWSLVVFILLEMPELALLLIGTSALVFIPAAYFTVRRFQWNLPSKDYNTTTDQMNIKGKGVIQK